MSHKSVNNFEKLRQEYPVFTFEKFDYNFNNDKLIIIFHFNLNNKYNFFPQLTFHIKKSDFHCELCDEFLQNAIFNIGMIELVSYWKAACSPEIHIKPFKLTKKQEDFWKKLYKNGLGEFFYTNKIRCNADALFNFSYGKNAHPTPKTRKINLSDSFLIPVGGGKDSIVGLEILKNFGKSNKTLVVNYRGATQNVLKAAELPDENKIEVQRTIYPLLLELNNQGFLNGHTPFSALLAFVCSLNAILYGIKNIALSNESSANESTIPGTKINHQYSKSFEFENDFRQYFCEFVSPSVNYFSLLRPLNELQIGAMFSGNTKYHKVFRSCNAGSKSDIWCCNCSKCLFTFIILSPFLSSEDLFKIFGSNLFDNENLKGYFEQLTGFSKEKPFECVGTINEVNAALLYLVKKNNRRLPFLLDYYKNTILPNIDSKVNIESVLTEFDNKHFLDNNLESAIKSTIENLNSRLI